MAKKPRRPKKRLNTTAVRTAGIPARIPKRWVKFVVGLFLLPVAWVLTQTLFTLFAHTTVQDRFWMSEEFWFFGMGCALWLIVFLCLPRPMLLYVFGHELTHAVVVWMMLGRVSRFEVNSHGGHIITNRVNTWIALAPYFVPIYSLLAIVVWGWVSLIYDISDYRQVLFALVGAGWAFHVTFTVIMIPKGQTDLTYGGTFFSVVLIYIMNLIVLTILLIVASPKVSFMGFGREFAHYAGDFCVWLIAMLKTLRLHLFAGA